LVEDSEKQTAESCTTEDASQANDSVTSADIDFLLGVDIKTAPEVQNNAAEVTSHSGSEISKPEIDELLMPHSRSVSSEVIDQLLFTDPTSETAATATTLTTTLTAATTPTLEAVNTQNLSTEKDLDEVPSGEEPEESSQQTPTKLSSSEIVDSLVSTLSAANDVKTSQVDESVVPMTSSVTTSDVNKVCDTNPPVAADQVKVLSEPQNVFNAGFAPVVPPMTQQLQPQPTAFVLPKPEESLSSENQMQPKKRQKVKHLPHENTNLIFFRQLSRKAQTKIGLFNL